MLPFALLASGCAAQTVEAAFASDFHCNAPVTVVESEAEGRFNATGCGREAVYQCVALNTYRTICDLQGVTETERSADYEPEPRRQPARAAKSDEVRVRNKKGHATLALDLQVGPKALLRLNAAPDKRADLVQLKLIRHETEEGTNECTLDFMINGQVVKTPKTIATRDGNLLSHRVQVGREMISELSAAQKISFRVCQERFSLDREQIAKVRDFIDRFLEEMAWKAPAREAGSSGGLLAPSGGWLTWTASGSPPPAIDGATLDARALFKKLSVSVFQLEAAQASATAQGSAVAISDSELLTNCHVLQGASKLVLRQDKQEWPTRLVRADPASDRCVIAVEGVKLTPVAGVRSYDSLEVGEAVYTLGSPVGLQLTLSNGILSGRREEEGRKYVQMTAPISPGSSGGGLFDARGNLLGITTLAIVGRERLNQALNFAIPADSFWQK